MDEIESVLFKWKEFEKLFCFHAYINRVLSCVSFICSFKFDATQSLWNLWDHSGHALVKSDIFGSLNYF